MSTVLPEPEPEQRNLDTTQATNPPAASSSQTHRASKSQGQGVRVLACFLCQQRKVKCDRKFPCANCTKHQTECVPATQARRRRRRFPEGELLGRLRKYEDLLRQNKVRFDPLHKSSTSGEKESPDGGSYDYDSDDEQQPRRPEVGSAGWSVSSTPREPESGTYEAKNVWHAMTQGFPDLNSDGKSTNDPVREVILRKAMDQHFDNDDPLLLGSRRMAVVDLAALHPEPVHIFKLWQIYLDNVNPLLKVTHTPSLQGRIIEAAGNPSLVHPYLEALMFSIYCMSILSLAGDDCQAMFGSSKERLLADYQFACQQALWNCGLLRSNDRDCLTALYLYLVSVHIGTHPRSLSPMLGMAIRIAQRMGLPDESSYSRCTVFEAEMRRRLWWSLVLFDARISELADYKTTILAPTWDCRIPLNVNDSDLRPEMKELPAMQGKATEALFAVVRSELGDFVRHTTFHLEFTNPALKPIAKELLGGGDMVALERMIEEEYLGFCDPENPLHFMTIWTTRGHLSRCRLMEHYARHSYSSPPLHQTEAQLDAAMIHAFRMLECDTRIMTSPLTKGYLWALRCNFPFVAYLHIVQDLRRRRSISPQVEQAWEVMSGNYEARFGSLPPKLFDTPVFRAFSNVVLQAWEPLETAFHQQSQDPMPLPRIVSSIRQRLAEMAENAQNADKTTEAQQEQQQPNDGVTNTEINDNIFTSMPMPMGFGNHQYDGGMGVGVQYSPADPREYPDNNMPVQNPFSLDLNNLNRYHWASMGWGWGLGNGRGW